MNFCRFAIVTLLVGLTLSCSIDPLRADDDPARAASPTEPQGTKKNSTSLDVIDESGKSHIVTAGDFAKLPRRQVSTRVGQAESKCEGVALVDLSESAGVSFGKDLRGPRAANIVLLEAQDGYRTALSQFEIDPATNDKMVLVIDRRDDKPLVENEGPYRLIIPDEKRPVRWIRMLRTIRVLNLKETPLIQ